MADFFYEKPYQFSKDTTRYRLLTGKYVEIAEYDGRRIMKINPEALVLLAREAISDLSFYLRTSHLEKLRKILDDPEATDNDRFVAYTMLRNTVALQRAIFPVAVRLPLSSEERRRCLQGVLMQ